MASRFTSWNLPRFWLYQPSEEDSLSIKSAARSFQNNGDYSILDQEYITFSISNLTDDSTDRYENLTIDFANQTLILKGTTYIFTKDIRFLAHKYIQTFTEKDYKFWFSYTDPADRSDRLLPFVLQEKDPLSVITLINAYRKLMFKYFLHISDSNAKAVEVIDRELVQFTGNIQVDISEKNENDTKIDRRKMFCTVEYERMCLYDSEYSSEPQFTLYFRNTSGLQEVQKMFMPMDASSLSIVTQDNAFKINNEVGNCEFIRVILKTRKVPREPFEDPVILVNYYSDPNFMTATKDEDSWELSPTGGKERDFTKLKVPWVPTETTDTNSGAIGHTSTGSIVAVDTPTFGSIMTQLDSSIDKFKDVEHITLPWVVAETEIQGLIDCGFEPETDFLSGGLDPDNFEHFLCCVKEIEDNILEQRYEIALSRMQSTRIIFRSSSSPSLKLIFKDNDLVLMKKIYYRSFS